MMRDVQIAGGRIEVRRFATPADIAALPEALVFNCTGLGSRELFGDQDLHPVRGQLAILEPQPEVRYADHRRPRLHVPAARRHHPRRHVRDRPVGRDAASRQTIARIVARHKRFFAASAAPLEGARSASNITSRHELSFAIPQSGGEQAEVLKDKLTPKAIVAALERAYRRPGRRQARRRGRACATAGAASSSAPSCATRSRPRTS